jgi:hypothetical protein
VKIFLLLASVVAASAAIAACGGGGGKENEDEPTATEEVAATESPGVDADGGDDSGDAGTNTAGDLSLLRGFALDPEAIGEGFAIERDDVSYTPAENVNGNAYDYAWWLATFEGTEYSGNLTRIPGMTAGFSRDLTSSAPASVEDIRLYVAAFEDDGAAATFFNDYAEKIVDKRCSDRAGDVATVTGIADSDVCDYQPSAREERVLGVVRDGRFLAIVTLHGDPGADHLGLVQETLGEMASRMKDAD